MRAQTARTTDRTLGISQAKYWQLRQVGLFATLPDGEIRELGDFSEIEYFRQGEVIYRPGDRSDRVFIIKSGNVKLYNTSDEGKEIILSLLGPGEIFGELAVAGEQRRHEHAKVVEDAFAFTVRRDRFEAFLNEHPDLALRITGVIGERQRRIEGRVLDLLSKDVRTRLAHTLAELAEDYGEPTDDGIRIPIRLTQTELAQIVGSARETTSTVFNDFRREGLVDTTDDREIVVKDWAALSAA